MQQCTFAHSTIMNSMPCVLENNYSSLFEKWNSSFTIEWRPYRKSSPTRNVVCARMCCTLCCSVFRGIFYADLIFAPMRSSDAVEKWTICTRVDAATLAYIVLWALMLSQPCISCTPPRAGEPLGFL